MAKKRSRLTPAEREERAAAVQQLIVDQIETLRTSEGFRNYLTMLARFHRYSFSNQMLILAQKPDATRVAGFRAWQEIGQQVKRGETGIKIYGFSKRTCRDDTCVERRADGESHQHKFFPIVTVFDQSQTEPMEGHEPIVEIVGELDGDGGGEDYARLRDRLAGVGFTIRVQSGMGQTQGYTEPGLHITLSDTLSPAGSFSTLIHEAAHNYLGHVDNMKPSEYQQHRGLCETEAESVAFVVASMLGHDTSASSIGYIAGWSGADLDLVRGTAERVAKVSSALHGFIEEGNEPARLEAPVELEAAA